MDKNREFKPDYVIGPHRTIQELMVYNGYNEAELSLRLDRSQPKTNELLNGRVPITKELSVRLENVFGVPAAFWLCSSLKYQRFLESSAANFTDEENELADKKLCNQLKKMGWLESVKTPGERVDGLRRFFGAANLTTVPEIYRKKCSGLSFRKEAPAINELALFSWIRIVEKEQESVGQVIFDREKLVKCIPRLRILTRETDPEIFIPELKKLCIEGGIILVIVQEISRTKVYGMTYWANENRPVVALSLRRKTHDMIWFSFFHEIGHILHHKSRKWIVETDSPDNKKIEAEADRFAAETLLPDNLYKEIISKPINLQAIKYYAEKGGIHPSLIVGRLQHNKVLSYGQFSEMKPVYKWNGKNISYS